MSADGETVWVVTKEWSRPYMGETTSVAGVFATEADAVAYIAEQKKKREAWTTYDYDSWRVRGDCALSPDAQPRGEGDAAPVCSVHNYPMHATWTCMECHDAQPRGEGARLTVTCHICMGSFVEPGPCPACQPAPPASGAPRCERCAGTGTVHFHEYGMPASVSMDCPACAGSGKHGTGGATP
jgi:hypothetical protein